MSSDDYYRQICVANAYYNSDAILASPSTVIYEFVPSGGDLFCNRNYPPGYMQLASPALVTAISQIVASKGGPDCFVLRDMGKTIYNNQLGGPGGSVYGIFGAPTTPDAYTNYTTFYIPVTVGGVGLMANTNAYQLAGGQM